MRTETVIYGLPINTCEIMVSNKKGQGFQSAAGLIRYFDEEDDRSPKIPPWLVVTLCIGSAVVVTIAAWLWPVA